MAKFIRKKSEDEAFQMAPMIDMVFLLLVFFMTVSTLAKDARPELELPVSASAEVPVEVMPREIISAIAHGDDWQYFLANRKVEPAQLKLHLAALNQQGQLNGVLLRADSRLPWRAWQAVMAMLHEQAIHEITFATFAE